MEADEIATQRQEEAGAARRATSNATRQKHVEKVLEAMASVPEGESASRIATGAGLSNAACKTILFDLESEGQVVQCKFRKANRDYEGWKLKHPDSRTN